MAMNQREMCQRENESSCTPANLGDAAIRISKSVWHGRIQTVKSKKGNRSCETSPQLVQHLRGYLCTWRPNPLGLLFATRNGTPWDLDTVRKRKLHPLLRELGIERAGFHAFRHRNATIMINSMCRWLRGRIDWPVGCPNHNGLHTRTE